MQNIVAEAYSKPNNIKATARAYPELEVYAGWCNGCGSDSGGGDSPAERIFDSKASVDEKNRSPGPLFEKCC